MTRTLRALAAAATGLLLGAALFTGPASADTDNESLTDDQVAELVAQGGVVSGGIITMPDETELSIGPASYDDCPANWMCLWDGYSYTGRMVRFGQGNHINAIPHLSAYRFNDKASSMRNRTQRDVRMWNHAEYHGFTICIEPGEHTTDLTNWMLQPANNSLSSLKVFTDDRACVS